MTPHVLDVRPFHERREEPFNEIMRAFDALEPGQPLLLINSFDPTPLIKVMKKRGYDSVSDSVGPEEWHILFTPCSDQT